MRGGACSHPRTRLYAEVRINSEEYSDFCVPRAAGRLAGRKKWPVHGLNLLKSPEKKSSDFLLPKQLSQVAFAAICCGFEISGHCTTPILIRAFELRLPGRHLPLLGAPPPPRAKPRGAGSERAQREQSERSGHDSRRGTRLGPRRGRGRTLCSAFELLGSSFVPICLK